MNLEIIKKKIKKSDVISFDVFETLIKRTFAKPKDLFKFINSLNLVDGFNFYETRILAENEANKYSNTPSYENIYMEFEKKTSKEIAALYKKTEVKYELKNCKANEEIVKLFEFAKLQGKIIIITSDMYFDSHIISLILKENNIVGYDRMYISSELKRSKHHGDIYKIIKADYNRKKIFHIGDSLRGDYLMCIKNNINCNQYTKYRYRKNLSWQDNLLEKNVINYAITNNPYYNLGYKILGPIIYTFCQWLHQCAIKKKINKIYFLSREGYFIKNIFEMMYDDIKCGYLYVSRRSTRCVELSKITSREELLNIYPIKKQITVRKYFAEIGITMENDEILTRDYILNLEEDILTKIIAINEINKEVLIRYLNESEFFENPIICDIGWNGSMQDSLTKLCNKHVTGFYFAVSHNDNSKLGYVSYNSVRAFVHLLENMFLGHHGTTLSYKEVNNKIEPILADYEFSDGVFNFIQEGAKSFVQFILESLGVNIYFSKSFVFEKLNKFGNTPTRKTIKLFSDTIYLEADKYHLFKSNGLLYYIFHLNRFKKDFYESGWKAAFIKANLGINLPIQKLYKKR